MAKYKAVTEIRYLAPGEDNHPDNTKVFEPGQVVTGLPGSVMKDLWANGSLRQVEDNEEDKTNDESADPGAGPDDGE